jgi:hypothetical protein
MNEEKFNQWAVVEIMGFNMIAGRVSEVSIGGASMIRVDVPETSHLPGYTKFFGAQAIYAITPVPEEAARKAAEGASQKPFVLYIPPELQLEEGENGED